MKTSVVKVTPKLAKLWLEKNVINRPLRPGAVQDFLALYMRGEWKLTHQGIAFDEDGNLADGQHRLHFIAELPEGTEVPILVTHGVAREAFYAMDRGKIRSNSDVLNKEKRLVEVARFLAGIHLGRSNAITPEYLVPFVAIVEGTHNDLLSFCGATCKTWSTTPIRTAAVVAILAGGDADYVKLIYRAMVMHEFSTMPPIAHSLFSSFMKGTVRATDKYDLLVRMLKVLNPKNASLSKVQIKDQPAAIASVRSLIRSELQKHQATEAKKKAPASARGAKSVVSCDYRIEGL